MTTSPTLIPKPTSYDDITALPPLWREWLMLKNTKSPEDCADPDSFNEANGNKMLDLEIRIMDTPARTLADAYAQMAILNFWVEEGNPDSARPAFERMSERVNVALETASSLVAMDAMDTCDVESLWSCCTMIRGRLDTLAEDFAALKAGVA